MERKNLYVAEKLRRYTTAAVDQVAQFFYPVDEIKLSQRLLLERTEDG